MSLRHPATGLEVSYEVSNQNKDPFMKIDDFVDCHPNDSALRIGYAVVVCPTALTTTATSDRDSYFIPWYTIRSFVPHFLWDDRWMINSEVGRNLKINEVTVLQGFNGGRG